MLNLHSFVFMTILLSFSSARAQKPITSPKMLDLLIRNYTFSGSLNMTKTGEMQSVHLPPNLSGSVRAHAARFRCGSLTRYGARFDEFHLGIGVHLFPCVDRVMLITHNLGLNWSISFYSANYNLSGYQLVSPILGLTAYSAGKKTSNNPNSSYPFEVKIRSDHGNPITVNFTGAMSHDDHANPLCASFGKDGSTVSIEPPISPYLCGSTSNGHFGLVVELPQAPPAPPPYGAEEGGGRVAMWKVAVGSSVGSALAIVLLGLLLVAMFAKVKKKARMVEMERRAYEEEALQVSMVGHVRAPVAVGTRTAPIIEHHFVHYKPK
ncbi:unnamed protein product [Linum trigynum]|uniref:Uncharacterized protein n=1 Tax=Linum trigynum TaxID=586398 RepID=A0AAV2DPM6_9ROSI